MVFQKKSFLLVNLFLKIRSQILLHLLSLGTTFKSPQFPINGEICKSRRKMNNRKQVEFCHVSCKIHYVLVCFAFIFIFSEFNPLSRTCFLNSQVKVAQLCPTLCNPLDYTGHGILQARILEWVAIPFSMGIIPTQGLNPGLPHCRQILYQLSHKGSPRILEWVA